MSAVFSVGILALIAGLAMPFGAWLAKIEWLQASRYSVGLHHAVLAFGAGTLLAAVALVLVPQGAENLSTAASGAFFILGGFMFMGLDILLDRWRTPASQLVAMLVDFIPESIALGATYILHPSSALLLALMIALQNIPEGFNAYRELRLGGSISGAKILKVFTMMAFLGPMAAVLGLMLLFDSPEVVSGIMLIAAGAILYSVFQDIAPKVVLEKHWLPPMGAVLGFTLGLLGYLLVG